MKSRFNPFLVSFAIVVSLSKALDANEVENSDNREHKQPDDWARDLDCDVFKRISEIDDYFQAIGNEDEGEDEDSEEDEELSNLTSSWRTQYLDEIFAYKISDHIGQGDNDPPDEKLLDDLFSSKTSEQVVQVEQPNDVFGYQISPTADKENRKSNDITSYFKRTICNYIKRKELKFNYLRGLYHEHLNHQSHLDLLSSTTKAELLARKIKFMRDGDNGSHLSKERDIRVKVDENELKFYIYGKSNLSEEPMIKISQLSFDDKTIQRLPVDMKDKKVAISIHGFWNNIGNSHQQALKNALLNKFDLVVLFDWSAYCRPLEFFSASENLMDVGQILGGYLTKLIEFKGLDTDNLSIFGYSLGAHLMAFTSRNIVSRKPELKPVNLLTAFDPALPMFRTKGLSKKDARTVQVIHTNSGILGQTKQIGHYDYYPNGGSQQPGCPSSKIASLTMQTHSK